MQSKIKLFFPASRLLCTVSELPQPPAVSQMVVQLQLWSHEKGVTGDPTLPQEGIHTAKAVNGSSILMLAPQKRAGPLQKEGRLQ